MELMCSTYEIWQQTLDGPETKLDSGKKYTL